jgi:tetratricopeptide (TPR) repeat protein
MRQLVIAFALLPFLTLAQHPHPDLLGKITLNDFQTDPHSIWYNKNYQEYAGASAVVTQLKKENFSGVSVKIVFGSWCGDSKREVPRFVKLLTQLDFPQSRLEFIAVDDSLPVYKQSPRHEDAGLAVYRVPTFIVYEKGKETGRIVEYPVESLERDLLAILQRKQYMPNYYSYPFIATWLQEGLLVDENVSARGLATQIYGKVQHESELNACGYVLLAARKMKEAITVFRINTSLFPQSANCFDSLGEAYVKAGQPERAIQSYEYALKLDPQSENARQQLEKLKGG